MPCVDKASITPGLVSRLVAALHAQAAHGDAKPSHRYSLADFGLTAGQVDERFGGDQRG